MPCRKLRTLPHHLSSRAELGFQRVGVCHSTVVKSSSKSRTISCNSCMPTLLRGALARSLNSSQRFRNASTFALKDSCLDSRRSNSEGAAPRSVTDDVPEVCSIFSDCSIFIDLSPRCIPEQRKTNSRAECSSRKIPPGPSDCKLGDKLQSSLQCLTGPTCLSSHQVPRARKRTARPWCFRYPWLTHQRS